MSDADELRASRARLARTAAAERRRFERALHGGLAQDLVAISVRLQLLRKLVERQSTDEARELIEELQREAREALDRTRLLASEAYPSSLDARGLGDALHEVARSAGVPARIDVAGRFPTSQEACVCFAVRALLEGAPPTTEVRISVREQHGSLLVEVEGFVAGNLVAARDLVEAAGGTLTLETQLVRASLPLDPV